MSVFDEFDKEFGFTTVKEPAKADFAQFDKEFGFTEPPQPSAIQTELPIESYTPQIEAAPATTTAIQPTEPIQPQPRIFEPETAQQIAGEVFTGEGIEEPVKKETKPGIVTPFKAAIRSIVGIPKSFLNTGKFISEQKLKRDEFYEDPETAKEYTEFMYGSEENKKKFVEEKRMQEKKLAEDYIKYAEENLPKFEAVLPPEWEEEINKAASGTLNPLKNPTEALQSWATNIADQTRFFISHLGGPAAGFGVASAGIGEEYLEMGRANGLTDDQIYENFKEATNIATALEYGSELATLGIAKKIPGVKKLTGPLKKFLGKHIVGKIIGAAGAPVLEGLTEWTQQGVFNYYLGKTAKDAGWTEDDVKKKFANENILKSRDFWIGFGTGGIISGAARVTELTGKEAVEARKAKKEAEKIAEEKRIEEKKETMLEEGGIITPKVIEKGKAPVSEKVALRGEEEAIPIEKQKIGEIETTKFGRPAPTREELEKLPQKEIGVPEYEKVPPPKEEKAEKKKPPPGIEITRAKEIKPEPEKEVLPVMKKKQIAPTTFKDSIAEVKEKVSPELWKRTKISFSEHYGNKGQYTLKKGDKGAIWYDKGRFNVVLNPANTAQETAATLFHEVMGHAGAANVLKQNATISKRMNSLYKLQRNSDLVKRLREAYKEEIAKDPAEANDLIYSEWIASNVESHLANPKKQGVAYQVWKHVKQFLIDLGVAKDSVDDVINSMVKEIRKIKDVKGEIMAKPEMAKKVEKSVKKEKPKSAEKKAPEPQTMLAKDISTNKVPEETFSDRFQQKIVDKFHRLKTIQKTLTPDVSEEMDVYTKQELIHGKTESKLDEFEQKYFKPLREKLVKSGIDLKNLEEYLYARHAKEANDHIQEIRPEFVEKNIPGSGMSNEEANAIKVAVMKSGKKEQYDELAKIVDDINSRARQVMLDAGLINEETKKTWEKYKHYVPLQGIGEEDVPMRTGKGFSIKGVESKRRLGRRSKASNILAHTVAQMNKAIIRAEKNKVGQVFLKYVQENPNPDLWEVEMVETKPKFNESTGEVEYREEKPRVYKDPKTGKIIEPMSVKIDGKEHKIFIKDTSLASGMVNMGAEKANKVLQTFGAINRYLSMVNTSLVPEFVVSNFSRDIQTALINIVGEKGLSNKEALKVGTAIVKSVPSSIKGVWQAERGKKETEWTNWYKEFKQQGGKIGFFGLQNIDDIQANLVKEIALMQPGKKSSAIKMYRATKDFVMTANEAVENGTRLATYVAMRKRGVSKQRAASIAKNITVNFNRKGEFGTLFNSFYVFSNAGIQGTARLFKALKSPRVRKLAAGIAVSSFALAQMNRWLAGEDDDDENYYDKIPNWVKENNIILMKPGTAGKYFKIPVPYGYNVFYAIGQATDKAVHNQDKKNVMESAGMVAGAMANAFNPLGSASTLVQTMTPTAGRWLVDLQLNKNFFGAPIMKEEKFGVPKARAYTYFKSTSEQSKKVAQALNDLTGGSKYQPGLIDISPDLMDYVSEYITGGAGRTFNQTISLGQKLATKKEIPTRTIPFVRRFMGEVPEFANIQKFYEYSDKLNAIRADYKEYLRTNPRKAAELREKNKPQLMATMKQPFSPQLLRQAFPMYYASLKRKLVIRTTELNAMKRELTELNKRKKYFDEIGNLGKVKEYEERMQSTVKKFNKRLGGLK